MGVILDSSVLIAAERQNLSVWQLLADVRGKAGNTQVAISVITLIELAHGMARADTPGRRSHRRQFLQEAQTAFNVYPVSASLAVHVGEIDGENRQRGIAVSLTDLIIGVTALELGYSVATSNVRHFQMIPGVSVLAV